MKVVVAGGTGFIGGELVRELEARGDEVVVLTRKARAPEGRVTFVQWTPNRPGSWTEALRGADAVVNLVGAGVLDERWSEERFRTLRESRVEPTRVLAEAIAALPEKPRVFLSASAVGYYGMRHQDETLDEASSAGTDKLAQLCVEWEAAAEPARQAGVRVVHPRIGIVLGKEGGALQKMAPAFKVGLGGPIGCGRQYFPWIHSRDAIRALVFAIDSEAVRGPFNVTGPSAVTMNHFSNALGKTLGRPSFLRVPSFALKLVMGEMAEVLLTGQRATPKKLNDAGFAFVFPEVECALGELFGRVKPKS